MDSKKNEKHKIMNLSRYIELVKSYFQQQMKSVSSFGYCIGWDNKIWRYKNVEEYKKHAFTQVRAMIDSGNLIEDVKLHKALDDLEDKKPTLKIYKK